jgi:hypothetical protein
MNIMVVDTFVAFRSRSALPVLPILNIDKLCVAAANALRFHVWRSR